MAEVFRCHDPGPHPERPARYDAVCEAVAASAVEVAEAPVAPTEALERVHDGAYLGAMERFCAAGRYAKKIACRRSVLGNNPGGGDPAYFGTKIVVHHKPKRRRALSGEPQSPVRPRRHSSGAAATAVGSCIWRRG